MQQPKAQSNYRRRRALLAYQRRHRRGATGDNMTAADQLELENTIKESILSIILSKSVPLCAGFIWIFLGTLFYNYYAGYGWMIGFYMSVNIGCGVGWSPPFLTENETDAFSKVFSSIHVTIGQIFVGIAVIYIAEQFMQDKESWMIQILQKKNNQETTKPWYHTYLKKLSRFKILFLLLIWVMIGVTFASTCIENWGVAEAFDFVLATLAKGGFRRIPNHSEDWKFLFVAFYTFFGIPLTIISLGMVVSFTLAGSEERSIYENIMVAVTPQELEVMKSVGIGVTENTILKQDFIVLMVVRIGAATPDVVIKINERFKNLDRKKLGKISYDDIVFRGHDITKSKSETIKKLLTRRVSSPGELQSKERRKTKLPSILKSASAGSDSRKSIIRDKRSPSRVFPTVSIGSKSKQKSALNIITELKNSDSLPHEDSDLDAEEETISIPTPSRSYSRSMSKFQITFSQSQSASKVFLIQDLTGELTPKK